MPASHLQKLIAVLCALMPLLPMAGLFAEQHSCACGMSQDACFCDHAAERMGAHCDLKRPGDCSMRPLQTHSAAVLIASFELRGWLQMRNGQKAGPVLAPAGSVLPVEERAPRPFSRSPELPPPRIFPTA